VEVWLHEFLNSAIYGGDLSASRTGFFTPGDITHVTQWIGGWMNPRSGLDAVKGKGKVVPVLELSTTP
jgi:hypothetical protein